MGDHQDGMGDHEERDKETNRTEGQLEKSTTLMIQKGTCISFESWLK